MIQVFSPSLGQDELLAVADSFNTGWIGKGRKVDEFERAWAEHIGVDPRHVTSISCATEGLFQAVQLLGIGSGDEVIIPTIHFIGAAQAVLSAGATPVFCDVDSQTLNTTGEFIADKTTNKTKAIILNHYGGVPYDFSGIKFFTNLGIKIIEDAACAPASTYKGQAVGTFGDIGVWSFDAMKVISTGDGGMVYCEKPAHTQMIRKSIYLGMNTESGLKALGDRWWEFSVGCAGRRAIMNDIAAGIGLEQLKKLDGFIERRRDITNLYAKHLAVLCLSRHLKQVGQLVVKGQHSFYFYWIQTPRRDELARFLRDAGIYCTFRYYPLHWVFKTGQHLPGAEQAARETLLLPLHQGLTDDEVSYICDKVREFYGS